MKIAYIFHFFFLFIQVYKNLLDYTSEKVDEYCGNSYKLNFQYSGMLCQPFLRYRYLRIRNQHHKLLIQICGICFCLYWKLNFCRSFIVFLNYILLFCKTKFTYIFVCIVYPLQSEMSSSEFTFFWWDRQLAKILNQTNYKYILYRLFHSCSGFIFSHFINIVALSAAIRFLQIMLHIDLCLTLQLIMYHKIQMKSKFLWP